MLHIVKNIFLIGFLSIWASCSNIKMLSQEDIYSAKFLKKIEGIQLIYRDGDKNGALKKLRELSDVSLSTVEKAKKYNFIGIIHFSNENYDTAIENFLIAKQNIGIDKNLNAQIDLNLASSYYKKDLYEKSYSVLKDIDSKSFNSKEKNNYYKLKLVLAQQLEKPKDIVESAIMLMGKTKSFNEIESSQYKDLLKSNYRKLGKTERVYILDEFKSSKSETAAYLAKEEALQRYYMGDRPGAEDVLSWIESEYSDSEDAAEFIKEFQFRIENYSKIDVGAVGVILPLSGKKRGFGKKALSGIDSALNFKENKVLAAKIYTRDSQNNPHVAVKMINDLIQKHHVSIIIGGLFSSTAKEEYLEAKKYGVMYISLSPVHLPKEEKNHLLVEVPGSIESQVDKIMNEEFLSRFGKRVAVMYPETEGGLAYVNEIWRKAGQGIVEVKAIEGYDRSNREFTDPVSKVLGVKFKRERKEELDLWKEIYSLKKKRSSIRRIQILKPIIDFDWVFVPAYPKDAIQIVPTFSYFDAKKLKFIGGPSWLSKSLIKEQRRLGSLFLVGTNPKNYSQEFASSFKNRNKKSPRLIETLSFEAMNLSLKIIDDAKFEKREELETRLLNFEALKGVTGSWQLKEGIWIKNMDFLKIKRGTVEQFDIGTLAPKEENEASS